MALHAYICPHDQVLQNLIRAVAVRTADRITTLLFLSFAAGNTAFGFVGEAFSGEELLFPGSKDKVSSTIGTLKRFISVTHR